MLKFKDDIQRLREITDLNGNQLQDVKGRYKYFHKHGDDESRGELIRRMRMHLVDPADQGELLEIIIGWGKKSG